jgi:predicted nucleotidyltransferase
MGVAPQQVETVRRLARRHFGDDAEIWLFGSRVDDGKKGGDYDFLIETSLDKADAIVERRIALIADLQSSGPFEDEKIDVIVKRRGSVFEIPIYAIAKEEGVRL